MAFKTNLFFILGTVILSGAAHAAGGKLNTHHCMFAIPRSHGEIFHGYGKTKQQASANAFAECKAYHDRSMPGHCQYYLDLDTADPGRYMICKRGTSVDTLSEVPK